MAFLWVAVVDLRHRDQRARAAAARHGRQVRQRAALHDTLQGHAELAMHRRHALVLSRHQEERLGHAGDARPGVVDARQLEPVELVVVQQQRRRHERASAGGRLVALDRQEAQASVDTR